LAIGGQKSCHWVRLGFYDDLIKPVGSTVPRMRRSEMAPWNGGIVFMIVFYRITFAMALVVWTWLLVKPNPVPTFIAESILDDIKFVMGKTLHLSAYAFLAWLGTHAFARPWWRAIGIGLALHGLGTEVAQYYGNLWYQTNRTGRWYDVIIDIIGVILGRWLRRYRTVR
jgi:hypothetical protein